MEIPYWKPGYPGSNLSGLAESLETLGKSPDLLEPVIQRGTMGFMSGALGVYSLIPQASEPLLRQDSRGQRTCQSPIYSFSDPYTPSFTCSHHRLYHARATTVFLWPRALSPPTDDLLAAFPCSKATMPDASCSDIVLFYILPSPQLLLSVLSSYLYPIKSRHVKILLVSFLSPSVVSGT